MRLLRSLPKAISPLRAIEWTIATFTIIGGLYIFTPLYAASKAANGPGTLAAALSHPALILFFGAVLVVGAAMVMFGLIKHRPELKSAGWFAILLTRTFQVLTTWLTVGLLPITWIYPATIVAVMIILWGCARVEVKSHARS